MEQHLFTHLFLCHAEDDRDTVAPLREALELHGYRCWVESRGLTGGDDREAVSLEAIRSARHVLVVVSIEALACTRVQAELAAALETANERTDGFKVISVVLPGVLMGLLTPFFPGAPQHIVVTEPAGVPGAHRGVHAFCRCARRIGISSRMPRKQPEMTWPSRVSSESSAAVSGQIGAGSGENSMISGNSP